MLLDVVENLGALGKIDEYDYMGYYDYDLQKPLKITIGKNIFNVTFIPNVCSNGEHDGIEGINIEQEK